MNSGLQVVRSGANIDRATAYDYIANSNWPTLNIISQGEIDIAGASDGKMVTIFQHNLGYYSPYLLFEYYWTYDPITFDKVYDKSKMRILPGSLGSQVLNHRDKLTTIPLFANERVLGYYVLFDYNLEVPFRPESNLASLPGKSSSNDFGVKSLASEAASRSMDSERIEDFNIDTGARSLTVHLNDKQIIPTSVNLLADRHALGYLPTPYIYQKDLIYGNDAIAFVSNKVSADNTRISVTGAQSTLGGEFYYMITKEPFLLVLP